jgi:serine/threonine-protein kinase
MDLAPGAAISAELTLLRPLDEGGMGSVWVAHHARLGGEVAVKFITEELKAREPTAVDRFEREAAVLRQVDSDHIVQSYGQGHAPDGTAFIAMELLSGMHLVDFLAARASWLSFSEAVELARQLAAALAAIHRLDIVHRDVKAENLQVTSSAPRLHLKLIDFGCAKVPALPHSAVLTAPGMVLGSADYMSPEQIVSAATVDHRADLWGMAVLLYMALLLELPFRGADLTDVFIAIRQSAYPSPRRLRPELPEAVDGFFARAFHRDLAGRFASAQDLAEGFARALGVGSADGPVAALVARLRRRER